MPLVSVIGATYPPKLALGTQDPGVRELSAVVHRVT